MVRSAKYNSIKFILVHVFPPSCSGKSGPVKVKLPNTFKIVKFQWRSIISANESCCWSIDDPILTINDKPVTSVDVCYKGQIHQYNGGVWACSSTSDQKDAIQFESGFYLISEVLIQRLTCCVNCYSLQVTSELPCQHSHILSAMYTSSKNSSLLSTIKTVSLMPTAMPKSTFTESKFYGLMSASTVEIMNHSDETYTNAFTYKSSMVNISTAMDSSTHSSLVSTAAVKDVGTTFTFRVSTGTTTTMLYSAESSIFGTLHQWTIDTTEPALRSTAQMPIPTSIGTSVVSSTVSIIPTSTSFSITPVTIVKTPSQTGFVNVSSVCTIMYMYL